MKMKVDMTINEVLYLLNGIDFNNKLDNNQLEKKTSSKIFVIEFEDTNLYRILYTLKILNVIEISFVTNIDDVDYRAERTQYLGSNIFYSPSEKKCKLPELYFIIIFFTLTPVVLSSLTYFRLTIPQIIYFDITNTFFFVNNSPMIISPGLFNF